MRKKRGEESEEKIKRIKKILRKEERKTGEETRRKKVGKERSQESRRNNS